MKIVRDWKNKANAQDVVTNVAMMGEHQEKSLVCHIGEDIRVRKSWRV